MINTSNHKKPHSRKWSSLYTQSDLFGLSSAISGRIRREMFEAFMDVTTPSGETTILDVGVTCERRRACNFLENLYPYPSRIIATGLEDASFLQQDFPGLRFLKADGACLPFKDKRFDIVTSFATIEHVWGLENQRLFLHELLRVGRCCCVTTPNRWYPVEFHTVTAFIHWLPPRLFRAILTFMGKSFYADEKNLNLLTEKDISRITPLGAKVQVRRFRLFGLVSNLMFFISE